MNKNKEEYDLLTKKQEENLNSLQSHINQKLQELTAQINSFEKNQKGIVPGIMDNLTAFKTQMEDKIRSMSDEISKFKMK